MRSESIAPAKFSGDAMLACCNSTSRRDGTADENSFQNLDSSIGVSAGRHIVHGPLHYPGGVADSRTGGWHRSPHCIVVHLHGDLRHRRWHLPFGMLADRSPIKPIVLIGGSVIAAA